MLNSIRKIRIIDSHAAEILVQLNQMNALEFIDEEPEIKLTTKQKEILNSRGKTPLSECVSVSSTLKNIRKNNGL